jgi:hypothetical protein
MCYIQYVLVSLIVISFNKMQSKADKENIWYS